MEKALLGLFFIRSVKISVVIITLNEEQNIERCLRSLLALADEILVMDSGSSDTTVSICRDLGAKVIQCDWEGYSSTKNKGNDLAAHDYILSVDADEVLDEELQQEILTLKTGGFDGAYRMRRKNFYAERWVRFGGWYPDWKIRLFNKKECRWEGDHVHEELRCSLPKVGDLNGHLEHFTIQNESHHLQTIDRYARLAAGRLYAAGKKISGPEAVFSVLAMFCKSYLWRLGFLEGRLGLSIAIMSAKSKWLRYIYFRDLSKIR